MKFSLKTFLATSLMTIGLMGCGDKTPTEAPASTTNTTEASAAPQPTTGKKYTVVTTGTAEPFSFKDERGTLTGIDVDLINEIGKVEGFAVEFFELPWQQVLPAVERGEYDIAINGINYSDERAEKYGVSKPYLYNPSAFMYKKDAMKKPMTLAEATGLSVAVMKDSKQDLEVSSVAGANVLRETNFFNAYKAMSNSKAQVVAYDMTVMQSLVKKMNDTSVTIVPYEDKSNKNTYNIMIVNKNNQELLTKINAGFDKLSQNGKLDEIRIKYLGE